MKTIRLELTRRHKLPPDTPQPNYHEDLLLVRDTMLAHPDDVIELHADDVQLGVRSKHTPIQYLLSICTSAGKLVSGELTLEGEKRLVKSNKPGRAGQKWLRWV